MLAELARVVRCGGRAVLLTSAENDITMQAALADVIPKNTWIQVCSRNRAANSSSAETQEDKRNHFKPGIPARSGAWELLHRYAFLLFSSMRARIYVLRRTAAPPPSPDESEASCRANLDTLRAWAHHSRLVRPRSKPAATIEDHEKSEEVGSRTADAGNIHQSEYGTPDVYVERLSGACNKLPWDDGTGWRKQWMRARPPMVVYSG